MIRARFAVTAFATALLAAACTSEPVAVQPELDETFGFDSGLTGWVPIADEAGGSEVEVVHTTERASAGSGSVRLALNAPSGGGAALLTRAFDLEPDQAYDVELLFDFASADAELSATPWTLVAGATTSQPSGAAGLAAVGDTGGEPGSVDFEPWDASVTGTAGPDGTLWVTLGVRVEGGGTRTYHLDELRVRLTRR